MYCEKCGAKVIDGANFCVKCGNKVLNDHSIIEGNSIDKKKTSLRIIFVAGIAAICILLVGIGILFSNSDFRSRLRCDAAVKLISDCDYESALEKVSDPETKREEVLRDYLLFRQEISNAPLLGNVNLDELISRQERCRQIINSGEDLGDVANQDLENFLFIADSAVELMSLYPTSDIDMLYEATEEYDRLHAHDPNPSFTIAEERDKIRMWLECAERVEKFIEKAGLRETFWLSCFLEVAEGSIESLQEDMDRAYEKHHDETANIHYTGWSAKFRPSYFFSEQYASVQERIAIDTWNALIYNLDKAAIVSGGIDGNFRFNLLSDATVEITGVVADSYDGPCVIPTTITSQGKSYPVTAISDNAFNGCQSITQFSIHEQISIGAKAFANCVSCEKIVLNEIPNYVMSDSFENSPLTIICDENIEQALLERFGYGSINNCTHTRDW